MKQNKSKAYQKGFREGYNNPSQFDQNSLLHNNSDMAKGVIAGICERKKDQQQNQVHFKG